MKLAPYACHPEQSAGRLHKEQYESERMPYLKDRDRVIHSAAFRRLEYKTQVFVNHAGDHYRTRLTHSLEVAQISKVIAFELGLNQELTEVIALSHDLGHPPFGHAGEQGLDEAAKKFGGFDHNVQTIKVLTFLEQRYAEFDGLNLTWETLEGAVKHNGPIKQPPLEIARFSEKFNLRLDSYASLEAQVAGLADDIAYCSHDIDDGIRAGIIKIEDIKQIQPLGAIYESVIVAYPTATASRIINETIRRIVKHMVNDLVHETKRHIKFNNINSVNEIRNMTSAVAQFSKETEAMKNALKDYLMQNVYRNYRVNRMTQKAIKIMKDLFAAFMDQPDCLPTEWFTKTKNKTDLEKAAIVKDYIAGMTDRFAIEEHKKLFNPNYY